METFESGHLFPKHAPFPNFPERLAGIIFYRENFNKLHYILDLKF